MQDYVPTPKGWQDYRKGNVRVRQTLKGWHYCTWEGIIPPLRGLRPLTFPFYNPVTLSGLKSTIKNFQTHFIIDLRKMIIKQSSTPLKGLVIAEFLSLLGNQIAAIAIPLLVLKYTNSTLTTSIAVAANTVTYVIAAFVGGSAIDRFGARNVSIVADLLSCFSVMALPLAFIIYSGNISPVVIFILVFAGALFDPTGVAARHTMVPGLSRLGVKHIDKVNALRGTLENAADFVGPAFGVALIAVVGINNTFFANAISFLLCAIIVAITIPARKIKPHTRQAVHVMYGIRFIFKNEKLRIVAITGMIAGFIISAFLGLLLSVLAVRYFNNATLFGLGMSAFGISATISALSFPKLNSLFSQSFIYYGGLLTMGVGILLSGVASSQYAVVACMALAGLAGAGNPLEQSILQQQTPGEIAGQVFAAFPALRFMAGTIGVIIAGVLTELYPVNSIIILGGSLLAITAIIGWVIFPLKQSLVRDY